MTKLSEQTCSEANITELAPQGNLSSSHESRHPGSYFPTVGSEGHCLCWGSHHRTDALTLPLSYSRLRKIRFLPLQGQSPSSLVSRGRTTQRGRMGQREPN